MELEGKVALVTGGSSGIGEATARLFADEGAKVAILARNEDEINTVADDMRNAGHDVLGLVADIRHTDAMQAAYRKIDDTWGKLDILFANAGVNGVWGPLDELDPDEWRQTIDINLNGTFFTVKYALPYLKQNGGGSIILNSSVNGNRMFSNTGATAYASTKAAMTAFGKMIALELAPDNIRVNIVCPGMVSTGIEENTDRQNIDEVRYPREFPAGKIPLTRGQAGTPHEIATLVTYLASDKASFITGTEIYADGAQSLFMG